MLLVSERCFLRIARGSFFADFLNGANEAYLTRPSSMRDRDLLSRSLRYSRGLASSPSQLSNVPAFHPKDTENETATKSAQLSIDIIQTNDEDSYLPWHVSPSLYLLPDALKESASYIYDMITDGKTLYSMILDFDRVCRMERSLELVQILFQDSFLP